MTDEEADDLTGWSGQFIPYDDTRGLISTRDQSGEDVYVLFYFENFYFHGDQQYGHNQLTGSHENLVHFDADYDDDSDEIIYYNGFYVSFIASLVWVGKKPIFDDSSDGEYSGDYDGSEYDETSVEEESEDSTDESEDEDIYGLVGKVDKIINSSTAILQCHVEGELQSIALERCRLYIDGKLCSTRRNSLARFIDVHDKVNFDASPVYDHPVVSYRVIMAWLGKKPRGEEVVTSEYAPTHKLRFT